MKKLIFSGLLSCSLLLSGIIGGHKTEAASDGKAVTNVALKYVGVPYRWGGTTPSGFDCSGFVDYTYKQVGVTLPRTAADLYNKGLAVAKSNLKEGDLVFFSTYKAGPSHVGIYISNNQFVHASDSGVKVDSLTSSYYKNTYYGSKRIDTNSPNGWIHSAGTWYYYDQGKMKKGWIKDGGKWYFLGTNGGMITGWLTWNGDRYYLDQSGAMDTGWVLLGGKWYFFYPDGSMAKNTKIQGYVVGSDGVWIK
jgi:glucan-binding YG repeat protein